MRENRKDLASSIKALTEDCSRPDWDGYGSMPVCQMAVSNVIAFSLALPDDIPSPEVSVDPDGAVSLEWLFGTGTGRILSVSVSANDRIPYAFIDGDVTESGVVTFDGTMIPEHILRIVRNMTMMRK